MMYDIIGLNWVSKTQPVLVRIASSVFILGLSIFAFLIIYVYVCIHLMFIYIHRKHK